MQRVRSLKSHVSQALAEGRMIQSHLGAVFTITAGVARPSDSQTNGEFAGLQRAINVYLSKFFDQMFGPAKLLLDSRDRAARSITVDAALGSRSLKATTAVLTDIADSSGFTVPIPKDIRQLADKSRMLAQRIATEAGAVANFTPIGVKAPPKPTTTSEPEKDPITDRSEQETSKKPKSKAGLVVAGLVVAGLGALLLLGGDDLGEDCGCPYV